MESAFQQGDGDKKQYRSYKCATYKARLALHIGVLQTPPAPVIELMAIFKARKASQATSDSQSLAVWKGLRTCCHNSITDCSCFYRKTEHKKHGASQEESPI
ncbi:PREDICTED: uncharacterized protein LOC105580712 [Cercocebus atys]|uniref:uncharacterized protein LOC105580712 n=1 Tax=Cercocebus atys TaxID=9531 RepID=UPI0005F56C74|nr:PREDICTED: uncharacterized protein LOC105580712 [Cercocebus atys]